jgi:hypothetical protein
MIQIAAHFHHVHEGTPSPKYLFLPRVATRLQLSRKTPTILPVERAQSIHSPYHLGPPGL